MEERAAVSPQKAAIPARGLVLVLVFLSGFCSLTYQVIWERTLKYCFGGDVVSASIIVSVFLLGLGLGGFLFRKVKARALPVLAVVELLIGLFGMWSYEIILRIDSILSRFSAGRGWGVESEFLLVFLGAFVFLLVPTVLMGATLPLMFESFIPKVAKNAKFIGLVYGINTLGAFAGALLPPLFFGSWGIPNTLRRTSALSLIIGTVLLAIALRKRKARAGLAEAVDAPEGIFRDRRNVFIVVFSFLSGFVALALEILFIRFIEILHSFSAYSFPLIVSAYLLAMGIGSMFWASRRDRMSAGKSRILPYVLQLLVAVLVPLAVFLFEFALRNKYAAFFNFFRMFQAATDLLDQGKVFLALRVFSIFCWPFLILIIPAVLVSSGIFPVLIKSLSESRLSLGKATGIVYLWNSIGCMAGSLVTGFAAIPVLGWHTSLILVTGLSLVAGGVGIFMEAFSGGARAEAALGRRTKLRYGLLLIAVAVASATIFSLSDAKIKYKLATGKYVAYTPLVSYREGVTGVAAAVKVDRGRNARVAIYSNGHIASNI
jgi:predicted membrane-bound spermidine synthase